MSKCLCMYGIVYVKYQGDPKLHCKVVVVVEKIIFKGPASPNEV